MNGRVHCGLICLLATVLSNAQEKYDANKPLSAETILLARLRYIVAENMQRMPNYTCGMAIERSVRSAKGRRFQLVDNLRLEVALAGGKELYSWPGAEKFEERDLTDMVSGGAIGTGDFALHVKSIYVSNSAQFTYAGKEVLNGIEAQSFRFEIPRSMSGYSFRVGPAEGIVGYKGQVWHNAESLDLMRIEIDVHDIPQHVPIARGQSTIDYARVRIGESDFTLPRNATIVLTDHTGGESRNHVVFTNCRQFAGESTLRFDDPDPALLEPVTAAPVTVTLPAGLDVALRLKNAIDGTKAAVGDPFEATVSRDVKVKGQLVLPKGAMVSGRIRYINVGRTSTPVHVIGLSVERFAFENKKGAFHATLAEPVVLGRTSSRLADRVPLNFREPEFKDPRVGVIYIVAPLFRLPSGFTANWRTLESSGVQQQ